MSEPQEVIKLSRPYKLRSCPIVVDSVHVSIFTTRWYGDCGGCDFCFDYCCQWGVDTEVPVMENIFRHADALERLTSVPRENWFGPADTYSAELWPGGRYHSTSAESGACVFLQPQDRGCTLHRFAVENAIDPMDLKPVYCWLYPLTMDDATPNMLEPDGSVWDHSAACLGPGPTLYWAQRSVLSVLFDPELVAECDVLQRRFVPDPDAAPTPALGPDDPRIQRREEVPALSARARAVRLPVIR